MEARPKPHLWAVQARCGHVGNGCYIPVSFALIAESASKAAEQARRLPRVKHDNKQAIISVKPLSFTEYRQLKHENFQDPYLHCSSVQDFRCIPDIENRIERVFRPDSRAHRPETAADKKQFFDHKERIRNVRNYMRLNPDLEELSSVDL